MSGDLEIGKQGHKTRAAVTGTGLNVQGICTVGETLQETSSSVWPLKTSDAAGAFLQTELSGRLSPSPRWRRTPVQRKCPARVANHETWVLPISVLRPNPRSRAARVGSPQVKDPSPGKGELSLIFFCSVLGLFVDTENWCQFELRPSADVSDAFS